jgi:hypothetical protein
MSTNNLDIFLTAVRAEVERAQAKHAPINSLHEGYAVILEEIEEFKDEVFKQTKARDTENIRTELIQSAAMCARCFTDVAIHL